MIRPEDPAEHPSANEHSHHAVGLRRDTLSFTETLAQSIANIAPTATPAINLQLVFASSGNGTWFTYVLATLGLVFIGVCINQFARHRAQPRGRSMPMWSRGSGRRRDSSSAGG